MPADVQEICKTLATLKAERSKHEEVWRQCCDLTDPLRGDGFNQDKLDAQSGQRKQAEILDSTGTDAAQLLAAEISSGTTPANAVWFELAASDETDEEKRFFGESALTVWENIHSSNYDAERMESVLDAIIIGWQAMYIDVDREVGGYVFERWSPAKVYLAASKPGGIPDCVYRVFTLTAEQAVAEFGEEALSEKTRKLAKAKPLDQIEIVHVIRPRREYKAGGRMARNMPIESVHVEVGEKRLLRESGYHEHPVAVARWARLPNSLYGVGQVYKALPDIKMLQDMWRLDLGAGEIAVGGMYVAEDDGVLNPRTIKIGPRKVIVANSVDSIKPLQSGSNFQYSDTRIQQLQARIRKTMLSDHLPPADGPTKTAYEYSVRLQMLRKILGPIFGRQQAEEMAPTVERCFGLAARAGILGAPPESLANRAYHVKYIGPLARAQRLEEVQAVERVAQDLTAIVALAPEALDNVDFDEAVRVIADGAGVPMKIVRDKDAVQAVRDARAQKQQQDQQAAMQQQAALTMQDAAAKRMATAQ